MNKTKPKLHSGLTIIELLIYLGVFSLVLGIVVQVMSGTFAIFARTKSLRSINQTGSSIIERLSYNIRASNGLGSTGNTFNTSPGAFSVVVPNGSGGTNTYYYTISNNRVVETINTGNGNYLNGTEISVTSFVVKQITAGDTSGLNITFTITDNRISPPQDATFSTTTLMRGTY